MLKYTNNTYCKYFLVFIFLVSLFSCRNYSQKLPYVKETLTKKVDTSSDKNKPVMQEFITDSSEYFLNGVIITSANDINLDNMKKVININERSVVLIHIFPFRFTDPLKNEYNNLYSPMDSTSLFKFLNNLEEGFKLFEKKESLYKYITRK